jgi:hypothetical protein
MNELYRNTLSSCALTMREHGIRPYRLNERFTIPSRLLRKGAE